jgi:hypothetical protein
MIESPDGSELKAYTFSEVHQRVDGISMLVFLLMWQLIAAYSFLENGDLFLLIMPLIFICTSACIYAISSAYTAKGRVGAALISVINILWLHSYPM